MQTVRTAARLFALTSLLAACGSRQVLIVCSDGTPTDDECVLDEAEEVRRELSCSDYADAGDQMLAQLVEACEADGGCCSCWFEPGALCRPGERND